MTSHTITGTHPQPVSYYLRLFGGTLRTMLDIGMLALGSALVGLAIAVLGDTFGLLGIGLEVSTSAALGAALVVGVVGAFAVGIASEGRYGSADSSRPYPIVDLAIGRIVGALVVAFALTTITDRTLEIASELSLPLQVGHGLIGSTGSAAFSFVPFIGVPLAMAARIGLIRAALPPQLDLAVLYVIWTVALLLMLEIPT